MVLLLVSIISEAIVSRDLRLSELLMKCLVKSGMNDGLQPFVFFKLVLLLFQVCCFRANSSCSFYILDCLGVAGCFIMICKHVKTD